MLRRGAHVLGRAPEQVFQLASYEPGGTAPALLAERRWQRAATSRPWLRLLDPGALADPGVMTLVGHGGEISACCYSPDGRSILSASWDQTLRRWDAATGELQQVLSGHDAWVLACCFSPDGRRIVSASHGESRIWDAGTGRELRALPRPAASFSDCAVSPEGTEVLTVAWDGTLSLWGLEDGRLRWSVAGHEDKVRAGAFSPDGQRLVTASSDKTVKLWRRATGELLRVLRGHRYQVFDCAYSPDGALVLSASGDKTLKLWTAEPRRRPWWRLRRDPPPRTLRGHRDLVLACAFSPDGAHIASASADRTLMLWTTADGRPAAVLTGYRDGVTACAFSPDGREVVTGCRDHTLKVWNVGAALAAPRRVRHGENVLACAVSPDERTAATASKDRTLRLWDVGTGESTRTLAGHSFWVDCCAFSPDGGSLVSGSWKRIKLWDLKTGKVRFTRGGHHWHVQSCAFSPDGRWIGSGDEAGRFFLWDAATGRRVAHLSGPRASRVTGCAFFPDGGAVVVSYTAHPRGRVSIWGLRPAALLADLDLPSGGCCLSPDGRRLAAWGDDWTLAVQDLGAGERQLEVRHRPRRLLACAFSPDGESLLCALDSGEVEVWDLARARKRVTLLGVRPLAAPGMWPGVAAVSTAGNVLAAGTDKGEVLLYRLMGIEWGPPLLTAVRLFHAAEKRYAARITADCPSCHERFVPGPEVLAAADAPPPCWALPAAAWERPALRSRCPRCGSPVRFNPFVLDNLA